MENQEDDGVFLHSFRPVQSMKLSRDESGEPEQAGPSEPEQDHTENSGGPTKLTSIEFRMQQLHNRRFLLLKMKRCRKKDEDHGGGSSEEPITEDDDDELRAIQKELQELQEKKEELGRAGVSFTASSNTVHHEQQPSYKETPRGGIYMLPPPPGDVTVAAEEPADSILPAERLGQTAGLTKCPSCSEVVVTETQSTVSETMWILCFLCSIVGCVAGCCVVPFFMKRLRNVHHQCPQCQARIHTHQPL